MQSTRPKKRVFVGVEEELDWIQFGQVRRVSTEREDIVAIRSSCALIIQDEPKCAFLFVKLHVNSKVVKILKTMKKIIVNRLP